MDWLETQDTVIEIDALTNAIVLEGFSPYVGTNGHWYEYSHTTHSFVDTGVNAQGPQGEQGPAGPSYNDTNIQRR